MNIYYMRDNHTFRKLTTDVAEAKAAIIEEFEAGYKYGMLGTRDAPIPHCSARGQLIPFLRDVEVFYERVREIGIGGGI